MRNKKQSFSKRLLTWLVMISMVAGTMVIFMPTTHAAAATSVISSATFQGAQAGPAALDQHLVVTFTEPVCGNADCSAGLTISNFTYTDIDTPTGFSTITAVTHTAGTNWALLDFGETSTAADTGDFISAKDIYTASGMVKGDSSTAARVALTSDTTAPTITATRWKDANTNLLVGFSEPVGDEASNILALADFAYVDAAVGNSAALDLATISTDRRWITFSTDVAVAVATDGADTIAITDNQLYDLVGNEIATPVPAAATTLTNWGFVAQDSTAPAISSAYGRIGADINGGNDMILVNFSEPVFSAATGTGALAIGDFAHSTATISAVTLHNAGDVVAVLDLNANQTAMGTIDTEADDNDIYDAFGNPILGTTTAVTIDDNTFPVLRGVWVNQFIDHKSDAPDGAPTVVGTNTAVTIVAVTTEATVSYPQDGSRMLKLTDETALAAGEGFVSQDLNVDLYDTTNALYEFTQVKFDAYYEDADAAATLDDNSDITFVINDTANFTTASEWAITTDLPEKTWTTVTIDLTGAIVGGTTALSSLTSPQYWGIKVAATTDIATNDDLYIDNVRFSRGASSKSNQVILEYSEAVDVTGDPAEAASAASATTCGNMTTSKTLAGMGAFASGTLTTKTLTNTVAKSADGTTYTITLADRAGGLITQATPVTLTGLFTPTTSVADKDGNAIVVESTHTPETVVDALDLTTAATAVTNFSPTLVTNGSVRFNWISPSQTAATFSHYVITYGTSAGVGVTSSLWDDTNEAALATATTAVGTVTGLTNATAYYFNIAGVDAKGIPTSFITEKSAIPGAVTSSGGDSTAPSAPTSVTATVNDAGKVVLTWTDPTATDFFNIKIAKSMGEGVDPASILATVGKDIETYTDNDVSMGDVVNYKLKALDTTGNASSFTSVVSLTVEIVEEEIVEEEEEIVEEEEVVEEEVVAEEEVLEDYVPEEGVEEEEEVVVETGGGEEVTVTDVSTHWARNYVTDLVEREIVSGYSDETFRPDNPITRAEFLKIVVEAYEIEMSDGTESFSDVSSGDWYYEYVVTAVDNNIVGGYANGTFKPNANITRAEAMKVLLETAGIDVSGDYDNVFTDVAGTAWYADYINYAAENGIVSGYSDETFRPNNTITRGEVAKIVSLLLAE